MINTSKIMARLSLILGIAMLGLSLLLSEYRIETAVGRGTERPLRWGPTLFRFTLAINGLWLLAAARILFSSSSHVRNGSRTRVTPGWAWLVLGALALTSLALRVYRLDSTLWLDEISTLREFVQRPFAEILTLFPHGNQHMLYSLMARAAVLTFGESTVSVRLPAVVFGVVSLWPLFLLARRLCSVSEALLCCALLTFSYHHVWFSQNARGYTALLFFATLATHLWLVCLDTNSWKCWAAYAAVVSAGFAAHIGMFFLVSAHVFWWLLSGVRGAGWRWRAAGAWIVACTLTLQFYALSLPHFLDVGMHEPSPESDWTSITWLIAHSWQGAQRGLGGLVPMILGMAMVSLGWHCIYRREPVAAFVTVVPVILVIVTFTLRKQNLFPRYFFFALGFGLLYLVAGAMAISERGFRQWNFRVRRAIGVALVCLMVVASAATLPRCYALPKQDFLGARDYVEGLRGPADDVVTVGLASIAYPGYYAPHWQAIETADQLQARIRSGRAVWLVYTLPAQIRGFHPSIWQLIQAHFRIDRVFPGTLQGGEVYVCRLRN
jgi:mannosyltransferase